MGKLEKIPTWQLTKVRKQKVHVYSDSILCLGKMPEHSEANQRCNAQLEEIQQSNSNRELFGIDGELIEFEWNIFPGLTSWEILPKVQENVQDQNIELEKIEGRIIFMSMFNDIDWTKRGNSEKRILNSEQVKSYAKTLVIFRPGDEKKKKKTVRKSQLHTCRKMRLHRHRDGGTYQRNWSPSIQGHQCFESWSSEKKSGRCTIHFHADSSNTELLFRTIHAANQLSIYGAVSSWCEEFAQRTPNQKESISEKFVAKENEQLLKSVKPQEVNLLVRAIIGHL